MLFNDVCCSRGGGKLGHPEKNTLYIGDDAENPTDISNRPSRGSNVFIHKRDLSVLLSSSSGSSLYRHIVPKDIPTISGFKTMMRHLRKMRKKNNTGKVLAHDF